jgi:hypothetical protein
VDQQSGADIGRRFDAHPGSDLPEEFVVIDLADQRGFTQQVGRGCDGVTPGIEVIELIGVAGRRDELSKALRLSSDGGATTREQITTIVKNISTLFDAVSANDTKLREFVSTIHQVSQIMADEDIDSGSTGHKLDQLIQRAGDLLDAHRDKVKQALQGVNTVLTTVTDQRRDLAELLDLAPLVADNAYNMIDRANGSVRARFLTDRLLFDSQYTKEVWQPHGKVDGRWRASKVQLL